MSEVSNWIESRILRGHTHGPFAVVAEITPALASELMKRNDENRLLSKTYTRRIAEQIRNGKFELNGETIVISKDGTLNDGQHRLTAIVEAGMPVQSFVVFGVDRDSRETVDTGRKRTPGDVLGMIGYKGAHKIAATARAIINYEDGASITRHREVQQIVDFCDENDGLLEDSNRGTAVSRAIGGLPSNWAALFWLAERSDSVAAVSFFDSLQTGVGLSPNSPVYVLRQRVIERPQSRVKLTDQEMFAITVKAFNAYASGQQIRALRWVESGNEDMPKFA